MRPVSPVECICWDSASCAWRLSWRDAARKRHYKKFSVDQYGSQAKAWDAATSEFCTLLARGEVSLSEPKPARAAATGLGVRFQKDNRSKPYMVQLMDPVSKKRVCHGHFANRQAAEEKARQVLQHQADSGCALRPPAAPQDQDDEPEVTLDSTHVGLRRGEAGRDKADKTLQSDDDKLAAKRLAVQWRRAEKQKHNDDAKGSWTRTTPTSGARRQATAQRKRAAAPDKA